MRAPGCHVEGRREVVGRSKAHTNAHACESGVLILWVSSLKWAHIPWSGECDTLERKVG